MSLASIWSRTGFRSRIGTAARFVAIAAIAAAAAGCFQPMYGDHTMAGTSALRDKLSAVEVQPISAASKEARLGIEVRNALLFSFNGSGATGAPTHRLAVRLTTNRAGVVVDVTTARPDVENYGIDAVYELRDIATDKVVITGNTFARVSYNIPGQEQRFARARGARDAEDRAAKVIADNISQRLASFFISGG
ncbi:MAG: hypothetical protein EPO23_14080 [Xanthobacteraceae bacterium]|nr:MAG: hypothetical protein EPO23_14080 [Xanthobacteraceae bacterium]